MIIRPETPRDYALIGDIHARAFSNRAAEPSIVALQRQVEGFDPELSLVAELAGQVVGHVLLSPQVVRLLSEDVPAVKVGPVGVYPLHHGQGIGKAMMEEGHRIAGDKGHILSYLIGHASYYPRFGYRTRAFGVAEISVEVKGLPTVQLVERTPVPGDIEALLALWKREGNNVDFAGEPGNHLLDWLSPNPGIESIVFLELESVVGYARVAKDKPEQPRMFLAAGGSERAVAAALAARLPPAVDTLMLPLHPASASASAFGTPSANAWNAAMALSLGSTRLDEYFRLVEAGTRTVGRVIWPVAFDL